MAATKDRQLADAMLPAVTQGGRNISVLANIGDLQDIDAALSHGAEGVGLLRTEFLFHDSATLPDEEEQFRVYCSVARVFGDKPVTIRTLDIGGDKPLPSYPLPAEDNPFPTSRYPVVPGASANIYSAITRTSPGRERIPNVANYAADGFNARGGQGRQNIDTRSGKTAGTYCRKSSGAGNYD